MENNNVSLVEDTHHKSPSIQQTTRTSHTTSELVHTQAVNLSMPPGGPTHPLGSIIHPTPTSTPLPLPSTQQLQVNVQQPITFVFERFCSGVPTPLSMHTPLPSPKPVVRPNEDATVDAMDTRPQRALLTINTTQRNDPVKKNRKKRKHQSYRTPLDSPISLNRDEDSKSDSDYGDNLLTEYATRSEACSDYDMEESSAISPVDGLKRLLMQFTAMSPVRLESILPVLLDNDIDDPDILLLIENEQFLRDLRGKNGSEISRGNCLLLWHGIQEHRNASTVHTPKSFSSCSSTSSYSPPPSSRNSSDLVSSLTPQKAKRPKLDVAREEHNDNLNSSLQDRYHHNNRFSNKQRVKAPKLSMSTIEEVHTRVDCVLSVVNSENERRKQIALSRNINAKPTVKFEDFVAELKQAHKIPVAFGTLRDMRFAYMLKKLDKHLYDETLATNRSNVTEFYRSCQEVCEENFKDEELEAALPWLDLKAKMYYKQY
ncbi:17652_t:CDS:2 [Acaulospora morrowiae]|uniref:17652_t:CDS:1 n=1 Tax=Acaulospora morrowiae TaxID=94023 RepID=A0A9N8WLW9_9GLOM|nr:17652_t:CDS:2 [Acaulospora morrowiae]